MIRFEEALEVAYRESDKFAPLEIPITDSIGRVLAEDIFSPVNLPPFSKSLVDGFAINSEDARDKKAIHEVIGRVMAGEYPQQKLERGQAMEIQAEASIPRGSDAVVPLDAIRVIMDGSRVGILKKVRKGDNIIFAGETLKKDEKIVSSGTYLSALEICLLTMIGINKIKIFPPPRVGVVSLGSELVEPGKKIRRGQIWDANGIALSAALFEMGLQPEYFGTVNLDIALVSKVLDQAKSCNILIICGTNQTSRQEILLKSLKELGGKVLFDGIAVKPCSTVMLAKLGKTLMFLLPADAFSVVCTFESYITPVLRYLMGFNTPYQVMVDAILDCKIRKGKEYHFFQPAIVYIKNSQLYVNKCGALGKGDILSYAKCNALMNIPQNVKTLKKGKPVKVIMTRFWGDFIKQD